MFYTPIPSIKPCSTHVNPRIRVFSPFLAFFALERQNCPPHAEKTATEAHRRPNSPAAPSRPSALRPVACPVARPLGLAPLWARGRGVCSAPFGQLHPAVVPPACAPCSSLPSASDALLMRLYELSCADGKGVGGWLSRPSAARPAPSPPASPPFRRPLAWSRRLWCAWWGAVAPAPAGRLSVVGLVGLAAGRALPCVLVTGWRVAFAPFRRGRGAPPAACVGGFEAFGFASAALARSCGRARGVFFPPNNPPFFPVALARRDAENFS